MNFIQTAWKVRPILEEIPATRDNDRLLIAEVWSREINTLPTEIIDGNNLLELLANGYIENPESITRIRRKLQETIQHLRGEKWEGRHGVEADCCSQLSFFDSWSY